MKRQNEGGLIKLPRAFYLLTILATLNFIASTLVQPFFSLYINQKVSTPFELGLIISLMSYTTLIVRLPLGLMSSRLGTWWIIPIVLIGQTTSNILYSIATQPIHFYLIRIFHAITLASLQPTLMSLATTFSPEGKKGEAIGIYLTSVGVAMMTGPLICSLLLHFFSFETILIIASSIPLSILPVYINLLKSEAISKQLSQTSTYETFSQSLLSFKEIISAKPILSLTYGRFMFAISYARA